MRKAAIAVGLVTLLAPVAGNIAVTHSNAKLAVVADGSPIPPLPPPAKHPALLADGGPLPPPGPPKKPGNAASSDLA
jgi:hypothetical protein